jgi:hypothetical protein
MICILARQEDDDDDDLRKKTMDPSLAKTMTMMMICTRRPWIPLSADDDADDLLRRTTDPQSAS